MRGLSRLFQYILWGLKLRMRMFKGIHDKRWLLSVQISPGPISRAYHSGKFVNGNIYGTTAKWQVLAFDAMFSHHQTATSPAREEGSGVRISPSEHPVRWVFFKRLTCMVHYKAESTPPLSFFSLFRQRVRFSAVTRQELMAEEEKYKRCYHILVCAFLTVVFFAILLVFFISLHCCMNC